MKVLIILFVSLFSVSLFAAKKTTTLNKRTAQIGIYINGSYVSKIDMSDIQSLDEQRENKDSFVSLRNIILRSHEINDLGYRSKTHFIDFIKSTLKFGRDMAMVCARNELGNIDVCEYDIVKSASIPTRVRTPVIRTDR